MLRGLQRLGDARGALNRIWHIHGQRQEGSGHRFDRLTSTFLATTKVPERGATLMSRTLLSPLRKRKPDAILLDIIKRVVDESSPAEFDGRLDDLWSLVTDRLKEEQRKDQEEARGKGRNGKWPGIDWMASSGMSAFRNAFARIRSAMARDGYEVIGGPTEWNQPPSAACDHVIIRTGVTEICTSRIPRRPSRLWGRSGEWRSVCLHSGNMPPSSTSRPSIWAFAGGGSVSPFAFYDLGGEFDSCVLPPHRRSSSH